MSDLTGPKQLFSGDTSVVDDTRKNDLGTVALDKDGNEFIYLPGIANNLPGIHIVYDSNHAVAPMAPSSIGPVALSMSSAIVNQYGWYLIRGGGSASSNSTGIGGAYISNVTGWVRTTATAGDWIQGYEIETVAAGGKSAVNISYPFVSNSAYLT